jgi:hypothetical protein
MDDEYLPTAELQANNFLAQFLSCLFSIKGFLALLLILSSPCLESVQKMMMQRKNVTRTHSNFMLQKKIYLEQ